LRCLRIFASNLFGHKQLLRLRQTMSCMTARSHSYMDLIICGKSDVVFDQASFLATPILEHVCSNPIYGARINQIAIFAVMLRL
jgi:hypothetical protein